MSYYVKFELMKVKIKTLTVCLLHGIRIELPNCNSNSKSDRIGIDLEIVELQFWCLVSKKN